MGRFACAPIGMIYGLDAYGSCTDYYSLNDAVCALEETGQRDAYIFCPRHGQDPFYPERIVCTFEDIQNGTLQARIQEEEQRIRKENGQEHAHAQEDGEIPHLSYSEDESRVSHDARPSLADRMVDAQARCAAPAAGQPEHSEERQDWNER